MRTLGAVLPAPSSGMMGRRIRLLVILLLFAGQALAAYYRYETCSTVTSSYPWRDISSSGTTITLADDSTSANIALGFTFNFGGTDYTQLRIGSNGWLFLGGAATTYINTALPASGVNAVIMPYWDDLNPASVASRIRYQTLGTAPNRVFVVSYLSVPHYCGGGSGCTSNQTTSITETFQAQLYETTGEVVFSYNNMTTHGDGWTTGPTPSGGLPEEGATIGVEVSDTDYTEYSFNTNSVANGSTLLFTPYSTTSKCGGTRFYMQNAAPDVTVATHRGAWDSTASVLQRKLSRTKAGVIASLGVAETSGTNNYDVLLLKLVSEPITTAQTISGTLNWVAGALESNAALNSHWHVHVYVTQGNTDNLRGTLYTNYTEALGVNEWPTTATGDGPTGVLTLTPVAIQANDRIVIEAGYVARNTSTTSYTGTLWYGGTNVTDLFPGGDETTYPGWWEFSQDLFPGPGFNHLRIEHPGSGVTCAPTTLTVKACADASCSSHYTGGVTGTLTATGTPTVNWVGGANFAIGATGLVTKDVQVTTAGTVTWGASGVAPVASNVTTCYIGATNSCSFTSNLAGFLFDVPHHASDTLQTITVSAVKQADNSLACTPAFASTSKTINFGCGYSNPATGTLPVVVGGSNISCGSTSGISLTFNASGVASTTVRYADVGQMSLAASYTGSGGSEPGLVMSGTDTFIAAPASFTVTPAGPYVAGSNFSVTVAAKNASGNTTPNFGKESTTENVTLGHTLTGPAGGNDPALSGTTTMPDASFQTGNGTATVSDVNWAEVGDISITATLASTSYLGSGLTASGSAAAGAFKPAYFDTVVTPGTGSLTYSGQPFAVQVTAKNASGGTTLNYKGAYARIVTLSDGNSGTNNSATLGTFSNAGIAAASFNNGVATTNTVSYRFNSKTTAPLEAPGSAPLKLRALDTDSVTSSGHTEGTTPLRAGRLRLVNFYGSELLKPRVEYRAEYWDGGRWATNALDSSNPIVAGNIATGGLTVNGVTALNNGIGFITFNTAAAGSYDIALDLNAVGVDTSCNAAHGGTAANKPWLQGYWSAPANCGGVAAWAQDPNARVRLGSPRAPYIYLRERY